LAYLVLFPHAHPREKLASLFWGDVSDEQARLSLRVALSTIRKELDDHLLLADRETIQLNPDCPIWLDAREFQKTVQDDPEPAVELYGGDLLPDLYDDWVTVERERLRSIYIDAMLRLVQQARSESKYQRAIELARQVLLTDRANEKAYQHLIFGYLATGNRTAALKQYEECQRASRDEMEVEPSQETTALYLRAQTEATNAKSPEALFTNLPTRLPSFVGRVDEIAQVKHALATTRMLTLVGAGGCGKTRLAIQVATELAAAERFKHGVWVGRSCGIERPSTCDANRCAGVQRERITRDAADCAAHQLFARERIIDYPGQLRAFAWRVCAIDRHVIERVSQVAGDGDEPRTAEHQRRNCLARPVIGTP